MKDNLSGFFIGAIFLCIGLLMYMKIDNLQNEVSIIREQLTYNTLTIKKEIRENKGK